MSRSERFGLVLSPAEKRALLWLTQQERISAAAVVRRLIWHAAYHLGEAACPLPPDSSLRDGHDGAEVAV